MTLLEDINYQKTTMKCNCRLLCSAEIATRQIKELKFIIDNNCADKERIIDKQDERIEELEVKLQELANEMMESYTDTGMAEFLGWHQIIEQALKG